MTLSLVLAFAAPAAAPAAISSIDWGRGEYLRIERRLNGSAEGRQEAPALAMAPDGSIAVAWQSREPSGPARLRLRVLDAFGEPSRAERVESGHFAAQRPAVVWLDRQPAVAAQALGLDGHRFGVLFQGRAANVRFLGDQTEPALVSLNDRVGAVAWVGQIDRDKRRVFLRLLRDGSPIGPEFRSSTADSGSEVFPSIAATNERLLVAWQRVEPGGGAVYVRAFDGSGRALGDERRLCEGIEPVVAAHPAGAVVTYVRALPNGTHRAFYQLLNAQLRPVGPERSLPLDGVSQNGATIACRSDGTFALAWTEWQSVASPLRRSVWIARFDRRGLMVGEPQRASAYGSGDHHLGAASGAQRIAYRDDGRIAVVWEGDGGFDDDSGVHATVFVPRTLAPRLEASDPRNAAPVEIAVATSLGEVKVQHVTEAAAPHEPPTFNPKDREDPWSGGVITGGVGFLGIVSTGWTPPDPHAAVGPNHIVAMTNGAIAFFTKDGTRTFQDEIEGTQGFWGGLNPGGFVFDPEAIYDPFSGRFMAMACERTGGRSYFLFAVSDDSDPNGTWFKYRFDVTAIADSSIDSPNMATDTQAVYLTADAFGGGQKYPILILRKSDVLVGNAPLTRTFLRTGTQSFGLPQNWDATAPQYMIEHFEASNNTTVRLWAIRDPLGTPSLVNFTLPVPTYSPPESAPSGGTSARITTFDSRFWSCMYRNGSLWATHHINSSRVVARWYEIQVNGWPNSGQNPSLRQSGDVDAGGTFRTYFSSIGVDGQGNAMLVCARSSPTDFISIFRAVRKANDPLGTMNDRDVIRTNTGAYSGSRWGDYSSSVPDPAADGVLWGHHEWAEGNAWRTWIFPYEVPGVPQTILPASVQVTRGQFLSGALADLFASDDRYFNVAARRPTEVAAASSEILLTATSPTESPTALAFRVEAAADAAPTRLRVELFNFQTGTWEQVGEVAGPTSDTRFDFGATGNLSRFVQSGTGEMRARVGFHDRGVTVAGWNTRYDQGVWLVTR
ncbi:MAG: hypothetical protein AB1725_01730 [Armatimonadota bacterium]